jgi:hypothetical protein
VRCTISSVSVLVPGRYLLQLFLPFCIKDEAESVKFSSKKQPPTLTVTLAVDSSIAPPPAAPTAPTAPAAPQQSTGAAAVPGSNGVRRRLRPQRQRQQQQQTSSQHSSSSSSSSIRSSFSFHPDNYPAARDLFGWEDENEVRASSKIARPLAGVYDWLDAKLGQEFTSVTWRLLPHSVQKEYDTPELLPLTLRTVALALLVGLLAALLAVVDSLYTWVRGGT